MKSVQLLSLTTIGNFLVLESNKVFQAVFEGLDFKNSLIARKYVKDVLNKTFDCKASKNGYKIRYGNVQFYENALKIGAATLNSQLQESKLFNAEDKQKIATCQLDEQKIKEINANIVDYGKNRTNLKSLLTKSKTFEGAIEYLADEIVFSFSNQNILHFVPVKLRNIDHYFQLVQRTKFGKFIQENSLIHIQFDSCKFNLSKNQYEVEAVLPEKVEKVILEEGWGTVLLKNIHKINPSIFSQYRKLEQQAKNTHKGIFAKPFQILSLVYTKNNLVATVQQIIEGYIFKIRSKNDEVIKIELAKIYCPLGNQIGAFACRQFARKNLIGREVNVFLTKDQGLNILGSLVRFADNKDIQTLMIQNGYGFVKDELKGTMFYAKLESLQKKAKELRKGIYDEKSVSLHQFYQDFTAGYSKKEKLDKKNILESKHNFLRITQAGDIGVVQKCVDPTTYILRVDCHKKLLRVKLDGVSKLMANPRLPQMIELQKMSEKYLHRNFYQRTVSMQLTEFNEANNYFVGILRHTAKGKEKLTFQQSILNEGLVILSNNGFLQQKWVECEKQAKNKKIGCWTPNLSHFVSNDLLDSQPKQFHGKFSWVQNGQMAYVQPDSVNEKLDKVYELLSNKEELKPVKQQDLVPGYLCAALYQQQMCRARIISIDGNNAIVKFIDWGNKQTVPLSAIREIPNELQYMPALCCQVELDLVRALKVKNPEHVQKLREYMMESDCKFVKSYANVVNVYAGETHLNTNLIYQGFLKADLSKIGDESIKKHMIQEMDKLRKQLVGVWDVEDDNSDVEVDDPYY